MDQVLRELDESHGTPGEGEGAPAPRNASADDPSTQDPDFAKSFFEFINRKLNPVCVLARTPKRGVGRGAQETWTGRPEMRSRPRLRGTGEWAARTEADGGLRRTRWRWISRRRRRERRSSGSSAEILRQRGAEWRHRPLVRATTIRFGSLPVDSELLAKICLMQVRGKAGGSGNAGVAEH